MQSFKWYPVVANINNISRHLLVYASLEDNNEGPMEIGHCVDLKTGDIVSLHEMTDFEYDHFEENFFNIATSNAHPAWNGFDFFRQQAFPRNDLIYNNEAINES